MASAEATEPTPLEKARALKAEGNQHFKAQKYFQALQSYQHAIKLLEGRSGRLVLSGSTDLRKTVYSNAATACMKLHDAQEIDRKGYAASALDYAEQAVQIDFAHAKAQYSLARARHAMGLRDMAVYGLIEAVQDLPHENLESAHSMLKLASQLAKKEYTGTKLEEVLAEVEAERAFVAERLTESESEPESEAEAEAEAEAQAGDEAEAEAEAEAGAG